MMRSNEEWLRALKSDGDEQQDALKDLRQTLVHGMRAYLAEARGYTLAPGSEDASQIVEDCAQDALLVIKQKIDTFRGESRFITWATTIAIRRLLSELRRRRWKHVSIEEAVIGRDVPDTPIDALQPADPEMALQQDEIWSLLKRIVEKDLTSRQRFVLVANAFQSMPLDLIAEQLGTNRDNVYKILHDARKKLKTCLTKRGITQEEILRIFEAKK